MPKLSKLSFSLLLLLIFLFSLSKQDYVSGLQPQFPYRNGRIYVKYNQYETDIGMLNVPFDTTLPTLPQGVTIGLRSMQNLHQDCLFVDYSFRITSFTLTNFTLSGSVGINYPMYFTKIVLDYATMSINGFFTYSLTPNTSYFKQTNGNQITFSWQYPCDFNQSQYYFIYFTYVMIELVGDFGNSNFQVSITDEYISEWNKKVSCVFTDAVDISSVVLTHMIYHIGQLSVDYGTRYFTFFDEWLQTSQKQIKWESYSYLQVWIGLVEFKGITSRFSFQLQYQFQFINDAETSYMQKQQRGQISFTISQSSTPIELKWRGFIYLRGDCNHRPGYPYPIYTNQLCYDFCPSNSFQAYQVCYYCSSYSPECEECQFDIDTFETTCTLCKSTSNSYLYNLSCQTCEEGNYYDTGAGNCLLCMLQNCSRCSLDSISCERCIENTNTGMVNGGCVVCNSSAYGRGGIGVCELCETGAENCQECVGGNEFQCRRCKDGYQLVGSDECVLCGARQYYNETDRNCWSCEDECLSCNSNIDCLLCRDVQGDNVQLIDGQCVLTLIEPQEQSQEQSQEQVQVPSNESYCVMSTFDLASNSCVPSPQLAAFASALTAVSSIPTINLAVNSFASLLNLLDDLSYFSYQNRNFSRNLKVFLGEMTNYTLFRFFPQDLSDKINNFVPSYQNSILLQDLGKTPSKFREIDGDVYFMKNTETLWVKTIPFSVIVFCFFSFIHWFSNKFIKENNLFQKYDYFGMLVVDLLSGNIQYLTFRCTQQLYQIVPYDTISYLNLVFSHSVLFLTIIYIFGNVIIFKSIYQNLESQYIIEQLFGSYWVVRLILLNIIKMLTGFIQAYIYYDIQLQSLILVFLYLLKSLILAITIKKVKNVLDYVIELTVSSLLALLCLLLFIQIQLELIDSNEEIVGNIQVPVIILSVVLEVFGLVTRILKECILIIYQFANKSSRSQNIFRMHQEEDNHKAFEINPKVKKISKRMKRLTEAKTQRIKRKNSSKANFREFYFLPFPRADMEN